MISLGLHLMNNEHTPDAGRRLDSATRSNFLVWWHHAGFVNPNLFVGTPIRHRSAIFGLNHQGQGRAELARLRAVNHCGINTSLSYR